MKGFAMLEVGKAGWIEKEKPTEVGFLDALVRPIAVSPCTSDVHTVAEGGLTDRPTPILGHEAVGEVVKVGEGVKNFKPGDRVLVCPGQPNYLSVEAQKGMGRHAEKLFGGLKFTIDQDGVFCELFPVTYADASLVHLPDDMPVESALMLTDMGSTGFTGVDEADIRIGDRVLVLGIGPVGLMAIAGAKLRGASQIIGVGSRPILIEKAKVYGATDVVNRKEGDIIEQVMALTNNEGVDSVIVAGGKNDILITALACAKPGATISSVNYFSFHEPIPIHPLAWGAGMANKQIKGSFSDGGSYYLNQLVQLVKYNRLDPSHLVTHRFHGFDKIEEAFKLMAEKPGDLIKAVVFID